MPFVKTVMYLVSAYHTLDIRSKVLVAQLVIKFWIGSALLSLHIHDHRKQMTLNVAFIQHALLVFKK